MSDSLISCEHVSKKFCRDLKKSLWYGLKDSLSDVLSGGIAKPAELELRESEFWANRDLNFEVSRGECLAVLGRNGAGKTTLLKMLNGLIKPDEGRIRIRGRVSALIALGAGFNPILTGRENVITNGSVLGMSRNQIHDALDDIVAFAGLEKFIDSPVQTYSSGMQVRLGFAVASTMKSDVLIVDEVLAVGDTAFKIACYNRIRAILPDTAVIFVSHNMNDVARVSNYALVLENGREKFLGDVVQGIHTYNGLNEAESREIVIHTSAEATDVSVPVLTHTTAGLSTSLKLEFTFTAAPGVAAQRLRLVFFDETETAVAEWDSSHHDILFEIQEGTNHIVAEVSDIRLRSGMYRLAVVLADSENFGYTVNVDQGLRLNVENLALGGAPYKV